MLLFHHHYRFIPFTTSFSLILFKISSVFLILSGCWDLRTFAISKLLILINLIETCFKLIFQLNSDIFLSCVFLFLKSQLIKGLLVSFIQFLEFGLILIITGTISTSITLSDILRAVISALLNLITMVLLEFELKIEQTIDSKKELMTR